MEEKLPENQPKKEPEQESWGDLFKFAVIAMAIVIPFRIFIAQPYMVEGSSMDPTFKDGDYLIVDQISYRFENPSREDVIILKYPKDHSKNFIKRIIGLPKETVSIRDGEVYIKGVDGEGFRVDDSYVKFGKKDNLDISLGENEYFVLGDNRANSSDSRYWGVLRKDEIVGRPLLRLLPVKTLSIFPGANTTEDEHD